MIAIIRTRIAENYKNTFILNKYMIMKLNNYNLLYHYNISIRMDY